MRISELEASTGIECIYGVEADTQGKTPPAGLQELGVLAQLAGGDLSGDVLDTLLYYRVAGVRVILEVPHDVAMTPEVALMLGASAEAEISLLPPEHNDDVAWRCYEESLSKYARAWFENNHFLTHLHPISGYFHYLCGRELGYEPTTLTADDYIGIRFLMPNERMQTLKARLEATFMDLLGGRAGLRELVLAVGAATYQRVASVVGEIEQRIAAQQAANDTGDHAPPNPSASLPPKPGTALRTIPIIGVAESNQGLASGTATETLSASTGSSPGDAALGHEE